MTRNRTIKKTISKGMVEVKEDMLIMSEYATIADRRATLRASVSS